MCVTPAVLWNLPAPASTRRLQVLKVCALSVFVSVQQQKSCIEFCGVGLYTIYECKNMYVCLYIYVCISQEPRGVTTAWLASTRQRRASTPPAITARRASTVQTQVCLPSVSCVGDRCRPPITGAHLKSDWGTCGRQQDIQPYYVFGSGKWIATNHPFPQTNLFPVTGGKKFMKFKSHLTSATLYFT
jgi:hypothetical protein